MKRLQRIFLDDRFSAALILLTLALATTASGVLSRVDNLLYDLGQRAITQPVPDDIVLVAIDESSLSQLGRWPWSRRLHAALIDRLAADGAKVIALDIVFAEPDTADQPADALLAEAIARAGNVVLPVLLESSRSNGQLLETLPLPQLLEQAAGLGRVHAELDADGIARSVFLWEGVGTAAWPHFGQAVLTVAGIRPPGLPAAAPAGAAAQPFALVRDRQRRVGFLGPPGHVRSVSYAQALTGEFAPGAFRGRIVLVGATAAGMGDLLPTPVSGLAAPMPGVEFNANVVAAMRDGRLIRELPRTPTLLLTVVVALLPLAWLARLNPLSGLLASLAWFVAVAAVGAFLPMLARLWMPVAGALLAILLAYPVWSWRRLESAGRFLDHELKRLRQELGAAAEPTVREAVPDPFQARIRQVQAAAHRLRHLQQERRETLAFISHDIRAPLASALMQIDSLLPQQQARLRAPLTRGLELAEAFLRTSRAEMLDPARFEELDCGAVLHQAIDDAHVTAREKSVRLVRELPADPLWVDGEFGLLHRAMLNLILNAIHHAPSGSAVELALRAAEGRAEISVTDHGPGIGETDQSRLFQRFSRIAQSGGGSGLGLYFVRTVAEKHGGAVKVRTAAGGPTCFTLSLPLAQH
ncbi:MAG: CHASE2 and HATPase_c domain-containing protein [Thiobacillus sp.]|nr:CHASE2 and HATPase_c domain-containing protein [Thiobacillus sp.]